MKMKPTNNKPVPTAISIFLMVVALLASRFLLPGTNDATVTESPTSVVESVEEQAADQQTVDEQSAQVDQDGEGQDEAVQETVGQESAQQEEVNQKDAEQGELNQEDTKQGEEQAADAQEATSVSEPDQTDASGSDAAEVSLRFRNKKLLNGHYEKHGKDMGFSSAEEYEAAAAKVVTAPDVLHKTESEDGDDVYYIESTNEFVVVSKDGYIRTYFLPDAGKRYYDRQ